MNKKRFCQACHNEKFGIKTRLRFDHTCGKGEINYSASAEIPKKSIENLYTPDCIRTFTGKYVNVFDPDPETICIEYIAHSLSFQCRFLAQLPVFFTIAQHSVNCSAGLPNEYKLQALMHDASEAYLLDFPPQIKNRLPEYKRIEVNLMHVIAQKFGFEYPLHPLVKANDRRLLEWEWVHFMLGESCFPSYYITTVEESEKLFMSTYNSLTNQ